MNKEAHLRNQRPADFTHQKKLKEWAERYQAERLKRLHEERELGEGAVHRLPERGPEPALVRDKAASYP